MQEGSHPRGGRGDERVNALQGCRIRYCGIALTLYSSLVVGALVLHAEEPVHFVSAGRLFQVRLSRPGICFVGSFHPAAPTAVRSPDGGYWGRVDENVLARLDPVSGQFDSRVTLPFRPYNHVITPDGRAYITHNTLTAEGFWVSVVDTCTGALLPPIKHIDGLRTDLIQEGGSVFLATRDVRTRRDLAIYRLAGPEGRAERVFQRSRAGCVLKIAARGDHLFVCHAGVGGDLEPRIEVFDLSRERVIRRIEGSRLGGITRILDHFTFDGRRGLLPCRTGGGGYGIAVFELDTLGLERIVPVSGRLFRIVGVRDNLVVYLDNPMGAPRGGPAAYFVDLETQREVKRIELDDGVRCVFQNQ